MREIKIQVLQIENRGIPEEPEIYTDQKEADQRYIEYWQEKWEKEKAFVHTPKPTTVEECAEFLCTEYAGDECLRYWEHTINVK